MVLTPVKFEVFKMEKNVSPKTQNRLILSTT
jgi:hypothetical protein